MDKNKKIAFYLPSLEYGGAERVVVTLVNGIAKRGYKIELVLSNAVGPYLKEVDSLVKVIDLNNSRSLFSIFGLIKYLNLYKPDVLISALDNANIISVLAKSIAGLSTKLLITQHSTLSSEKQYDKSIKGSIVRKLMLLLYARADVVIGVSEGVSKDLKKQLGVKLNLVTIYNPIVDDRIQSMQKEEVSCSWFDEGEPPVIMSAGRLTEAKDFELLINAFAEIRKNRICRLIIVGDGILKSKLIQLSVQLEIEKDVLITGYQSNPFKWMKQCSVFVVSSRWEGLSNVLIEAMACGRKIVSTDCPNGPSEILEGGKWGMLVPVGDIGALVTAIEETLDSNPSVNVVERANFFSVEKSVDQYLKIMDL